MKLHVHGIINHRLHKRMLFGSYDHWEHGSNFICSMLHEHLTTLKNEISPDQWPHTLFVQVDNCWKKNKNTTMLRYLGLLIQFGWFKSVQMYSLPTDHTHEDIDQMFSTWNIHYWKKGLQSVASIPEFIDWAYPNVEKRPIFKMVQNCYNIKEWLHEYAIKMSHHTSF